MFFAILLIFLALSSFPGLGEAKSALPNLAADFMNLTITGTKTAIPTNTVESGKSLTYTIVFSSDTKIDSLVITDVVPSLTHYKSGTIGGISSDILDILPKVLDDKIMRWRVLDVLTDTLITLTFAVTVNSPISNGLTISNTIELLNTIVAYTNTVSSTPTLKIQKAGPTIAVLDTPIIYTIQYYNVGTMTATNVIITNTLPDGMLFVSSDVSPTNQIGSQISWLIDTLAPNVSQRPIILTVTVNRPGQLTTTTSIASYEGISDTEAISLTVERQKKPAITVTKKASVHEAKIGDTIMYTYHITNTGEVDLTDIRLIDDKLGNVMLGSTKLKPTIDTVATKTYTVTKNEFNLPGHLLINVVTATASGKPQIGKPILVTATTIETVTISQPEPVSITTYLPIILKQEPPPTPTPSPTSAIAKNPAIKVLKMANPTVASLGQEIIYNYIVTNIGDVDLIDVKLIDDKLQLNESLGELATGQAKTNIPSQHYIVKRGDLHAITNTATATGKFDKILVTDTSTVIVTIPTTEFSIQSRNTGELTLETRFTDNELAFSCKIANGELKYCGSLHPGTYKLIAFTEKCGKLETTKTYNAGPVTQGIFCN